MTSGKKILGVTAGVVVLLVAGRVAIGFLNQPDDKTLILQAVKDAQQASKEGRPGGVLDFLSKSLNVNGEAAGGYGSEISKFIKNQKPDVEFQDLSPQIFGETARIETPATVKVNILTFSKDVPIPKVEIELKKENDYEWFIIPKKSWKITDIRAAGVDFSNFAPGN